VNIDGAQSYAFVFNILQKMCLWGLAPKPQAPLRSKVTTIDSKCIVERIGVVVGIQKYDNIKCDTCIITIRPILVLRIVKSRGVLYITNTAFNDRGT
jgi:hypothetical protein